MKGKRNAGLFLFMIIVAFCVFAMLRLSDTGNAFLSEYVSNAKNNIDNIKSIFSKNTVDSNENTVSETNMPSDASSATPQTAEKSPDAGQTPLPDTSQSIQATSEPSKPEFTEVASSSSAALTVPFENADGTQYAVYKDYLVCANKTSLMAFDKYGGSKWAVAVSYSKPILKTAGSYILLADKGGKTINVFIGEKLLYSVSTDNIINYASISSKGEVIAVTEKEQYRSCVLVYNKEGDVIFSRSVGSNEVIAAAISPSRHIAVTLLNTDEGVSSQVQMWDINSEEEYTGFIDFNDTLVFDLEFSKEILSTMSDKGIYGINRRCKNIWTVSPESASDKIIYTDNDKYGSRITVFDNNANAYIKISDFRGKVIKNISSDIIPDFADIHSPTVAYNNERDVFVGNYNKTMLSYTSYKNITGGLLIDSDALLLIHSNSLEFIDINKLSQ